MTKLNTGISTKKLRNTMFATIEATIKEYKDLANAEKNINFTIKTKKDVITEEYKGIEMDEMAKSKVEYYEKELLRTTKNIKLIEVLVKDLEDTKENVKREEKTLFILNS